MIYRNFTLGSFIRSIFLLCIGISAVSTHLWGQTATSADSVTTAADTSDSSKSIRGYLIR